MIAARVLTAVCVTVLFTAAGCNRRVPPPAAPAPPPPVVEEAPAATPPPPPPPAAPAAAAPAPLTEEEIFARMSLEELNATRPLGDAYFDYDQFTLRADARAVLERNAEWLRRWTSTRIAIEGHADSRGTSEYNLALGERRAAAVRDYLISLGIAANRLVAISRGEEAPVCVEEDERCWQQNRRGHSVITAK